jgi:Ca2+-binding RTX toxin-like protein
MCDLCAVDPFVAWHNIEAVAAGPMQMGTAAGGSSNGGSIAVNTQLVNQLDTGSHWAASSGAIAPSFTFGITTSNAFAGTFGEAPGWSALSPSQATAIRIAINLWDDLISSNISEAQSPNTADIKISNTITDVGYAHSYYPGAVGAESNTWSRTDGSVWFNTGASTLQNASIGNYGFMTFVHELGHALGLDHAGNYNGSGASYGSTGSGWMFVEDSRQYTIMSYFAASSTGADWGGAEAQTPMVYDILAIQQLYGADNSTRAGNTVYGFNSNTGSPVFDFDRNARPVLAIWDGAGSDTIDLSRWTSGSNLSLVAGSYSSANNMTKNIAIAYNVDIENAVTGSGNDTITGNDLDNRLNSGGGNDTVNGAGGDDTIIGGAGRDTLIGGSGNDRIYFDASDDLASLNGGAGMDTLIQSGFHSAFDFAAHGFEVMQSVFQDLTGANWDTRIDTYDASNHLVRSETIMDDGTHKVGDGSTVANPSVAIVSTKVAVAEGRINVGAIKASVTNSVASAKFSIAGGSDAAKFKINAETGNLRFIGPMNFESPKDANGDNIYAVKVKATASGSQDTQSIAVKVTNVNEAPKLYIKSANIKGMVKVKENLATGIQFKGVDPDHSGNLKFAIAGGIDSEFFKIDSASGLLRFKKAPDFEARADSNHNNIYGVMVQVSDGNLVAKRYLKVSVLNQSEAHVAQQSIDNTLDAAPEWHGFSEQKSGLAQPLIPNDWLFG